MSEHEMIDCIKEELSKEGFQIIPRPYGTYRGGKTCDIFAEKENELHGFEVKCLTHIGRASYECDRAIGQCLRYHNLLNYEFVKCNLFRGFDGKIADKITLILAYDEKELEPYIEGVKTIIKRYNLPIRVKTCAKL